MIIEPPACGEAIIRKVKPRWHARCSRSLRKWSKEQEKDNESETNSGSEKDDESVSERSESASNTPRGLTRLERQNVQKLNYLERKARHAHNISAEIRACFEENQPGLSGANNEPSHGNGDVCKCCEPVLLKYSDTFMGLKMQGSELKKRKKINPHPKRPNFDHYHDLKKQNEWLRSNVFDAMGNHLFCCKCIHAALGVSYKRLACQRGAQYSELLRTVTKQEVSSVNLLSCQQDAIYPCLHGGNLLTVVRNLLFDIHTSAMASQGSHKVP